MVPKLAAAELRCDLLKMERTSMVAKMEDRIKVGLAPVSSMILDHLRQCKTGLSLPTPETINRLAVQFNQGALMQYQYGEIERAEMLCRGEIEFFAELGARSEHRPLCLANMVPPYINLARIYGQKGCVEKSLGIFEEVYRFGMQQQDLVVLGHRLRIADAPSIFAAAPSYQKVMLSCKVVEATRILQTLEDYPALLALAEQNTDLPEYQDAFFQQYLAEAHCRAQLGLGQHEKALEAFGDCCGRIPTNSIDRILIHSLLSQIYREFGRYDFAVKVLNQMESHLAALEKLGRKLPVLRQLSYRLALERHLLGDDAAALGPAEKAFHWCGEWNDHPGSIRCAILLLRICSDPESGAYSSSGQHRWYNELQQIATTTFFRLDRACAYWELGLSAGLVAVGEKPSQESAREFLENSYHLYSSVPFVDSERSAKIVKRLLRATESHPRTFSAQRAMDSSAIDAAFDALMELVPKPLAVSQLGAAI